jgi:hypothetical protein
MWLERFEFLSLLRISLAIRLAEDIKHFNDPSAIRPKSCWDASKTACREEAGPAPVRQGWRVPRLCFAATALTDRRCPGKRPAKQSWLKMSETAPSRQEQPKSHPAGFRRRQRAACNQPIP